MIKYESRGEMLSVRIINLASIYVFRYTYKIIDCLNKLQKRWKVL